MAAALLAAGHAVTVYDLSRTALERAVRTGASAAGSPAEMGAAVETLLLSLPTPADVEAALIGTAGVLARPAGGLVVVDTSTVDPATTRRLAAAAAEVGVGYLDAPVLGRPEACGAWTFPVGGDAAAVEAVRPVLQALGRTVVHAGPAGAGNAVKLLNALMFGAINAVTAEILTAATRVGVSAGTFFETVAGSEAATVSPLFRDLGRKMIDRDFAPVFTLDLLAKDTALALAMVQAAHGAAPVGAAAATLVALASVHGYGAEDSSALVKLLEGPIGGTVAVPGPTPVPSP